MTAPPPRHAGCGLQAVDAPEPLLEDWPGGGRPGPCRPAGGRSAGGPADSAVAAGAAAAGLRLIGGRYRLAGSIGRGNMGVVWRARDELLGRDVAIKEIRLPADVSETERSNAYQRTLREARSAARVSHSAVATVHDVIEELGRPWIVMELIHGCSLDRVIGEQGPVSPRRAVEIGRQLLAAVAAAHAVGVLHRDVKPANVLLTRHGRAVLTDFGVAAIEGDPSLTEAGMVIGTQAFLAPERIRGEAVTSAADLWSLGATLYAAVEGHGPYDHCGDATATMAAIVTTDVPPPKTAGPLTAVITALLSRDPATRPSVDAAARMLEAVTDAAAKAPSHRKPLSRSPWRAWRAPLRAVAAATACLIVLVPVSFWALGHTVGPIRTAPSKAVIGPAVPSSPKPLPTRTQAAAAGGWRLVWSDEFIGPAGGAPDASKWNHDIGGSGWGNSELEYYTDSTANAELDGHGHLVITARNAAGSGLSCWYGPCRYTSARLNTLGRFAFEYGRISARIEFPRGQGLWPSFWAIGADFGSVGWPQCGMIDILSDHRSTSDTVYSGLVGPGYNSLSSDSSSSGTFAGSYHTFTADWYPDHISFFVDGHLYATKYRSQAGADWVFDRPFSLVLDLAVGGNQPGAPNARTTFPQQMLVDWVRVYQAVGPAAAAGSTRSTLKPPRQNPH
jgi:serine/threonine protein kinase/beta-glucanase (GH16 family)